MTHIYKLILEPADFIVFTKTTTPYWQLSNREFIHNYLLISAFRNDNFILMSKQNIDFDNKLYITPAVKRSNGTNIQYINNIDDVDNRLEIIPPESIDYESFLITQEEISKKKMISLQEDNGLFKIFYKKLEILNYELFPKDVIRINTPSNMVDLSFYDEIKDGHIIYLRPTPIALYLIGRIPYFKVKDDKMISTIAIPKQMRGQLELG